MWAMAFQLQVGMTVLDIYEASSMRAIKMIERSLLSSRWVSYKCHTIQSLTQFHPQVLFSGEHAEDWTG